MRKKQNYPKGIYFLGGKFFVSLLLLLVLVGKFSKAVLSEEREGVDFPFTVRDHKIGITDGQFILYTYQVLLDRFPEEEGAIHWMKYLDRGWSRFDIFKAFLNSEEFKTREGLDNDRNYIYRLYNYFLKRTPAQSDLEYNLTLLREWVATKGKEKAWFDLFSMFLSSTEFSNVNCKSEGYSYGRRLKPGAPSLRDLFSRNAKFQPLSKGEKVYLNFQGTSVQTIWDQKLPIIYFENKYIGFTRGYLGNDKFDIFMLYSSDGTHFSQAKRVFNERNEGMSLYDPQISIDYSYCPERYVMVMECSGNLCFSESSTPWYSWSWGKPKLVVKGGNFNGRYISASTGASITDFSGKRYLYWTVVDDSRTSFETSSHQRLPDDGDEKTYTKGSEMSSSDWTSNADGGVVLLNAESNVYCSSVWDCNNKDKQDVKYESGRYYLIYNGANYYRCTRPEEDIKKGFLNDWGLSVARSTTPLGNFDLDKMGKLIDSVNKNICGVSYPVINEIDGELYMYYAFYPQEGGNFTVRSKLIWIGDINFDGEINGLDYILLAQKFGTSACGNVGDINEDCKVNAFDWAFLKK